MIKYSKAAIAAHPAPAVGEGFDYALACKVTHEARLAFDSPKPKYDKESILNQIADGLADGVTLRSMCRKDGMPAYRTVYNWISDDADMAARIACAREAGYDSIADDIMQIVDEPPMLTATGGVDSGDVGHKRLRAEMRLKLLAKWSPKKYGDKLAVGGADDLPPVQITEIVRKIVR